MEPQLDTANMAFRGAWRRGYEAAQQGGFSGAANPYTKSKGGHAKYWEQGFRAGSEALATPARRREWAQKLRKVEFAGARMLRISGDVAMPYIGGVSMRVRSDVDVAVASGNIRSVWSTMTVRVAGRYREEMPAVGIEVVCLAEVRLWEADRIPVQIWVEYAQESLLTTVWPQIREQVHAVAKSLGFPVVLLPTRKAGVPHPREMEVPLPALPVASESEED